MTTEHSGDQNHSGSSSSSSDLSDSSPQVEALIQQLSQEEKQDEKASASRELLFDELNAGKLREREREYTDVEKHWIRSKAWLKVARELAEVAKKNLRGGLRYFTLPGFHCLDVGLLLREKLLDVDPNNPGSIYVAGFEADPTKYGLMAGRQPKFKLLANCPVEEALTDTKNPYYSDLQSMFPFDMVNLDLTTSLTPKHEGPYSTTMRAIDCIFKRQSGHPWRWALFLTFRNLHSDWEKGALAQLFENLQNNIAAFPAVREAFFERHRENSVNNLQQRNIESCISQAVVKWLVDRAHSFNIQLESYHCYQYQRYPVPHPKYTICKLVLVFSDGPVSIIQIPTKNTPRQIWMERNLVTCIQQHKPLDVEEKLLDISLNNPQIFDQLKEDVTRLCAIM
jgi:hypothetical protein